MHLWCERSRWAEDCAGTVTSFEYQLKRVGPEVIGGLIALPFDDAGDIPPSSR